MPFLPPTNSVKALKVHKVTAKEPEKQTSWCSRKMISKLGSGGH